MTIPTAVPPTEENFMQALGALEEIDRVMHLVAENVQVSLGELHKLFQRIEDPELRNAIQRSCKAIETQMTDAMSVASQNAENFGVGYCPRVSHHAN